MSANPERGRRRVVAIAGIAVLAIAAWRVLSLGVADHLADVDPHAALGWRGAHPEALLDAAEAADGADAGRLARRAIAAAPLRGAGYRRLAELAVDAGDAARAATLFGIAARLAPRDQTAQAWLFDHHLAGGDVDRALAALDPLLRVEPNLVPRALPVLAVLAQAPVAQDAFADRLATAPPWRRDVLRGLPAAATDIDAMAAFFDRLRKGGGLTLADLDPWLERLGEEGRWGEAYLAWVAQLPPGRRERLGNVADGGFELPPDQGGFGWQFGRVPGARIDRVRGAGPDGGHALRVVFEHQRVAFSHVRQRLALPPGRWRLSGQVRREDLRTERGLVWTVSCATPSGHGVLVDTAPIRGHGDWQAFSAEFTVPEGCGGQWLELRLPARVPAERRIGGQVWFDDLKITRIP